MAWTHRGAWAAAWIAAAAALAGGCMFRRGKISPFEPEARRLGVVMTFAQKSPDEGQEGFPAVLSDQLTKALFDTKRLRVIDPGRLESTLKEMKLAAGKPLDAGTMAEVCNKLRAETAVFGEILSAARQRTEKKKVSETLTVQVEAKLVLCRTTEVLSSARAMGRASRSYEAEKAPRQDLLPSQALADASRKIAFQLVKDLLPR